MVELVDSVDLGSSGLAVQVRVLSPAPKIGAPSKGAPILVSGRRARTHVNATVRWTVAIRRLDAGCSIVYSSPVARTREVISTGNSGEVERIAVFADILLAFPDGLRYNDTELQLKSLKKILIA